MAATTAVTSLVGHEKRWDALARAFRRGTVPQTLLISGPPHVGKWTLARRYAQLLLCPNVDLTTSQSQPCGACRVCHQVEIETFPDFKVYRPIVSSVKEERDRVVAPEALEGSILTIAMAREFGDEAMRKPLSGRRKVMILQQAERMETPAQNALLKTFEEPVEGLSIVLLCDNPDELLPTVLSRCWHLPLGIAPQREVVHWLRESFPTATLQDVEGAALVSAGRPGLAWREMQRLQGEGEARVSRAAQSMQLVERIEQAHPVAALRFTEDALQLAKEWWSEDHEGLKELKKGDAKVVRSQVARFLDELAAAYRTRWMQASQGEMSTRSEGAQWADGLDQIRKTRHYILRNANTSLALDVLFGQLIGNAARNSHRIPQRNGTGFEAQTVNRHLPRERNV